MKKVIKAVAVVIALLVVIGGAVGGTIARSFLKTPASESAEEVDVEIPKGAGTRAVAETLAKEHLVSNPVYFRAWVRVKRADASLRAGELKFRRNMTPPEVLEALLHGEQVMHKITVPEGRTAREIAEIVEKSGLGKGDEFLALTENAEFARSLGVPATRLEGYLFPDTYNFQRAAGAKLIAATMVKHFQAVWTPELAARAKARGLDTHQAVTLASIVEKETGVPEERAIIAGVFYNRIAKGMRLESDPTIIYGMLMKGKYDGNIRHDDIRDPSNLYSTYVIKGLPPGPIASPGKDALLAVCDPQKHDKLFFVATGQGGHVFATTVQEHNRNVEKYQLHGRHKPG